jgi:hypothetical protein
MKKTFFYIFFLFPFAVHSQDYIDYQKEITKAESFILDSNYQKAVEVYGTLFKKYDFVFAEHCFTATQTAVVANNYTLAFRFLERSTKQGIKMDVIYNDSILKQLTIHPSWEKFAINYDSLRNIYISNVNWELRWKINELYNLDQKYRDKHELHPWNFLWRPFIRMKWKRVVKRIVETDLIPLIKENGFPGEKLIGLDEKWMHHKSKKDRYNSSFCYMILIHYYSFPNKNNNELLMMELKKGNIPPKYYASLNDFITRWGKERDPKQYFNEWHRNVEIENREAINKNRLSIGLETFEELKLKEKRGLKIYKEKPKMIIRLWHWCG